MAEDEKRIPSADEPGYDDGIDELPAWRPDGILGGRGLDLKQIDEPRVGNPFGGIVQDPTWETTILATLLSYLLFFPLAFWILWRSKVVPHRHKVVLSVLMVAGLVAVGLRVAGVF